MTNLFTRLFGRENAQVPTLVAKLEAPVLDASFVVANGQNEEQKEVLAMLEKLTCEKSEQERQYRNKYRAAVVPIEVLLSEAELAEKKQEEAKKAAELEELKKEESKKLAESEEVRYKSLTQLFRNAAEEMDVSKVVNPDSVMKLTVDYSILHPAHSNCEGGMKYVSVIPTARFDYIPHVPKGKCYRNFSTHFEYFIPVEKIEALGFKLEEIAQSIKSSDINTTVDEFCCEDRKFRTIIKVLNANGEKFKFQNMQEIADLLKEKSPASFAKLAELYGKVGNKKYADYLGKIVANRVSPSEFIERKAKARELITQNSFGVEKYLHPKFREQLYNVRAKIETLKVHREDELKLYANALSAESMATKKAELIAKYDSQITKLCAQEQELNQSLGNLRTLVTGLKNKGRRVIFKSDYKLLDGAYRVLTKYPLKYEK